MFSKIPLWLLSISIFIILTTLYLGFSWLSLQLSSPQKPQVLPVLARIEVAKQIIYLEVPQTPEQEAQGLMYRTIIPRNREFYLKSIRLKRSNFPCKTFSYQSIQFF